MNKILINNLKAYLVDLIEKNREWKSKYPAGHGKTYTDGYIECSEKVTSNLIKIIREHEKEEDILYEVPKVKKSVIEHEDIYAFLDKDSMSIITVSRNKKDGGTNIFPNQVNKINADLLRYVSDFLKEIEKEKRKL